MWRHVEAERPCSHEVDHQLEFDRLLYGQLCWLGPFQDFVRIRGGLAGKIGQVRPLGRPPRSTNSLATPIAGNLFAAMLAMRLYSPNSIGLGITMRASACSYHRAERADEVVRANGRHELKL